MIRALNPDRQPLRGDALALIAGLLLPLALAPLAWRPLALLSPALWLWTLLDATPRRAAWRGLLFGLGSFGLGVSWVFVSIHLYGHAPVVLAALLTLLFVAAMALYPTLLAWLLAHLSRHVPGAALTLFPLLWVAIEWLRGWLLTGFPWLQLGTAVLDTPWAGWLPLLGVLGGSYLLALLAAVAVQALRGSLHWGWPLLGLLLISGAGLWSQQQAWTRPLPQSRVTVGLVQPNIPQDLKWTPEQRQATLERLDQLSAPLWGVDLLLWPEAAVPLFFHQAQDYLAQAGQRAEQSGSALLLGIPFMTMAAQGSGFVAHNSLIALGNGEGLYHKQRLVPFGEYVPLERWLRGLIAFFDLPMSDFTAGAAGQPPISTTQGWRILPLICYEVAYADLARAQPADLLLTVSNDAWFGDSFGPWQHLEIARLRAAENGRPLLRATNDGISALIDHQGALLLQSERFVAQSLHGEVVLTAGETPYHRFGDWPLFGVGLATLAAALYRRARRRYQR